MSSNYIVLEKTLECPLDCKEIKPVNPKGNQLWTFIGRTDAEAEAPIIWPPYVKSQLTGKDPDAGKYWRQKEKGMTEDEMVGWHHRLNGYVQLNSVQLLSHVWLFATPWTAACQASLSITNSWSLLKLTSIKSVMPSIMTWVWANSGTWWRTWKPGVLPSMGSQKVGYD